METETGKGKSNDREKSSDDYCFYAIHSEEISEEACLQTNAINKNKSWSTASMATSHMASSKDFFNHLNLGN